MMSHSRLHNLHCFTAHKNNLSQKSRGLADIGLNHASSLLLFHLFCDLLGCEGAIEDFVAVLLYLALFTVIESPKYDHTILVSFF